MPATRSLHHDAFAITAPGLEPFTAAELAALGLTVEGTEPGGVRFSCDAAGLARANLASRTASRIVVRVASFTAKSFAELERKVGQVDWSPWLAPGQPVEARVTSKKSRLYHAGAVEERLAKWLGGRTDLPVASLVVRIHRDVVTLSLDSSGELLHRRGWRLATAKAPMRETLAAALLLAARYDGSAPLVDPLCGAGTIAIEAAAIARRMAPGLGRAFAFTTWPAYDGAAYDRELAAARAAVLPAAPHPILGSDRDAGAIAASRANAERAGVSADITFTEAALTAAPFPDAPRGWLVTNPPYGERVGERGPLRDLYARLGQLAQSRLAGWTLAMISADPSFEHATGLAWTTAARTSNGGLPIALVTTAA